MTYQPPPPPEGYGYQQPPPPAYGYQPQAQVAYAHWGYRVGAYLVDSLVVSIPAIAGGIIGGILSGVGQSANSGALSGIGGLFIVLGYIGTLIVAIWNLFIRQGQSGQSIGKQVLSIRLVSLQTGQPLGGGMTFVRYLCHIIDSLPCYIGYLWPLWDEKRQTFADKIVNSVVVRTG